MTSKGAVVRNRFFNVAVLGSMILCGNAIAQEMPEPVRQPRATVKKTAQFVGVTEASTANKVLVYTDTANTIGEAPTVFATATGLGVGTATPQARLQIFGTETQDVFAGMGPDISSAGTGFNFGYAGTSFGKGAGFFNVRPSSGTVAPNPSLRFETKNIQRMIIAQDGKIGIGAKFAPPTNAIPGAGVAATVVLDVDGDINMTGNINAKYQDVAEWVDASGDLKAGTVVVLDSTHNNKVMPSGTSYDTMVAGVVSERPGIVLGEAAENREKVATTGRVRVFVDATKAPIHIGDLLVTSDTPGMAMKSEPMSINGRSFHQPGTIIGKALESMESGKGEILVLLTLQ